MNEKNLKIEEKFKKAVENQKKNYFDAAEKILVEILDSEPDHINANFFLGTLLLQKKEFNKARELFLKVISLNPNNPDSYNNLGIIMKELGQKSKAIICFQKVIELNPNHKMVHNNLGIVFKESGEYEKALNSYEKAIQIDSNNADAYNNLGIIFIEYGNHEKAAEYFKKAIKIKPNFLKAYGNLLFSYCWLTDGNKYLDLAKNYSDMIPNYNNFNIKKNNSSKKDLKIGFISGDFKDHPVTYFLLDTVKSLKNKNLKLFAYSNSAIRDNLTYMLEKNFNKWTSIFNKSDQDIIKTIRDDNLDVLFDLSGHTKGNKLFVLKNRCAPVQATWSGWLASTGIKEIDYIIADPHVLNSKDQSMFVEKIYVLKKIWQSMSISNLDQNIFIPEKNKDDPIIFGSFNNTIKINENVIKTWSKILKEIPNSKLFLKYGSFDIPEVKKNFIEKFKLYGVEKTRIIIEGRSNRNEYLKIYNKIDIVLDSFPINGATTNFEASFMGVPILTMFSQNSAWFRSGVSINKNLNMEDWIAKNEEEYILKAIKFSENKQNLIELKKDLRNIALKSPLFDTENFSKNFYEMILDMKSK